MESNEKKAEDLMNILEMQEEILQFEHFTNEDALELGAFMLKEAKSRDYHIAIAIERSNGAIVFQAMMDGTTPDNLESIQRKFATVERVERSSLAWFMKLKEREESMADRYMDTSIYSCAGGGFPIRIEEAGVIGVIAVSGMNHVQDHDFIIKCLSKYLHIDEVPRINKADIRH